MARSTPVSYVTGQLSDVSVPVGFCVEKRVSACIQLSAGFGRSYCADSYSGWSGVNAALLNLCFRFPSTGFLPLLSLPSTQAFAHWMQLLLPEHLALSYPLQCTRELATSQGLQLNLSKLKLIILLRKTWMGEIKIAQPSLKGKPYSYLIFIEHSTPRCDHTAFTISKVKLLYFSVNYSYRSFFSPHYFLIKQVIINYSSDSLINLFSVCMCSCGNQRSSSGIIPHITSDRVLSLKSLPSRLDWPTSGPRVCLSAYSHPWNYTTTPAFVYVCAF